MGEVVGRTVGMDPIVHVIVLLAHKSNRRMSFLILKRYVGRYFRARSRDNENVMNAGAQRVMFNKFLQNGRICWSTNPGLFSAKRKVQSWTHLMINLSWILSGINAFPS